MKKGFTLVEMLGVLVILGIIALISFPVIRSSFNTSTSDLSKEQIKSIEEAARIWATNNSSELSETTDRYVTIQELKRSGIIENKDILSVADEGKLTGCVKIYYENNKYNYKYDKYEDIFGCHYIDYQQVEYIASTGTQYIDTGIIPDQDTGFDIIYLTKDNIGYDNSGYGSVMGARRGSKQNELQITTYTTEVNGFAGTLRYGTTENNAGITTNIKMRSTLINKVYTNNDDVEITLSDTFTSPKSLTIFALNNNGTITQYGKVQLYSLKIYDGDTLVRDYVPCYRISDGVAGLYDTVNEEFYTNAGTGEFNIGENI